MLKSPDSVHELPSNSSVKPKPAGGEGGAYPPKATPAVWVPAPAKYLLPVPKAPLFVQSVPSYFSVVVCWSCPPAITAAVWVPKPHAEPLPVFKLFPSVQVDPFHSSDSLLVG